MQEKKLLTTLKADYSNKKIESALQPAREPTTETTKATKAKTKHKRLPLKLGEEFLNVIKNKKKI